MNPDRTAAVLLSAAAQQLSVTFLFHISVKESSEWPVVALLSGRMFHLGDWDECLTAKASDFKGQYCLVQTLVRHEQSSQHEPSRRHLDRPPDNSSARHVTEEVSAARPNAEYTYLYTYICTYVGTL